MNFNILKSGVLILLISFLAACKKSSDDPKPAPALSATSLVVITNNASNVIVKTYEDLNGKADALLSAVTKLKSSATEANLKSAKEAWVASRAPWEASEGFLYGPVNTGGLDPAMDTWPVDVTSMDAILASGKAITPAVLEANNEARGFHLIEYLLWGLKSNKKASDFSSRELEYLVAAAQDLKNNTDLLHKGWITGNKLTKNQPYVSFFLNAGKSGNTKYTSKKNALLEFIDGMITIATEVGDAKIADAFNENGSPQPEKEESRFSHNSKVDFADNIRSIQNIYLGKYGSAGQGKGVSTIIIATGNKALDTETKHKITEAIAGIEAIPGTFTDAISNNRPAVSAAKAKVAALKKHLESKLKPYVSKLPGLD